MEGMEEEVEVDSSEEGRELSLTPSPPNPSPAPALPRICSRPICRSDRSRVMLSRPSGEHFLTRLKPSRAVSKQHSHSSDQIYGDDGEKRRKGGEEENEEEEGNEEKKKWKRKKERESRAYPLRAGGMGNVVSVG